MEEHDHNKEPMVLTSPARMAKGIIIIGVVLAAGATFVAFFFDDMIANPPAVTRIKQPTTTPPTTTPPAAAGTTTIEILSGASVQGSPDFKPDDGQVPLGNKVVWKNDDNVAHTATSGTGPDDANHGKIFDTSIINGGESSKPVDLTGAKEGDTINYYCFIHPYMTSKLTVIAAEKGGATGTPNSSPAAATLNILQGASVQGSKAFDPSEIKVPKGSEIHIANQDNVPHTVTSGTGPDDANHGKVFDTNIINAGESFELTLSNVNAGSYDYYCFIHPYMKGKLVVE
jgi:plastocyanin